METWTILAVFSVNIKLFENKKLEREGQIGVVSEFKDKCDQSPMCLSFIPPGPVSIHCYPVVGQ